MKKVFKSISFAVMILTLIFSTNINVYAKSQPYAYKKMVEKDASKLKITEEITQFTLNKHIEENIVEENLQEEPQIDSINEAKEQKVAEPEYSITQEDGILYANTSVNIRELPSASSARIGSLSYAQEIQKTGICDNGWTQVNYNGTIAYVNSKYLQDSKPEIIISIENDINDDNDENNESYEIYEENAIHESPTYTEPEYSGIIQSNGTASAQRLKTIESYYYKTPQKARDLLESHGWQIICTDEDFGTKYGFTYQISALTVFSDKIVYIANASYAENAIMHEVGHVYDYECDNENDLVSQYQQFVDIFNAERDTFCSVHYTHENNTSTPREYFAEFFSVMCEDPDLIKDICPQTYNYISNL